MCYLCGRTVCDLSGMNKYKTKLHQQIVQLASNRSCGMQSKTLDKSVGTAPTTKLFPNFSPLFNKMY